MNDWQKCASINPNICHGSPYITNTRVMVSVILDNLADGMIADEIVADSPPLALIDVRAARCCVRANLILDAVVLVRERA